MTKYTIELSKKTEEYIRKQFESDKEFWSRCKGHQTTDKFEEYLVWFIEDYIAEIEESLKEDE